MIKSFIDYFISEYYSKEIKREYFATPTIINKKEEPLKVNEVIEAIRYFMLKHKVSYNYKYGKNLKFIRSQSKLKNLNDYQIIAFIVDEILWKLEPSNFRKAEYESEYNTYAYSFTIDEAPSVIKLLDKVESANKKAKQLYIKLKFITKNITVNDDKKLMGLTPTTKDGEFVIADFEYSWLDIISIHYSNQ